jgi:hypothetical protein
VTLEAICATHDELVMNVNAGRRWRVSVQMKLAKDLPLKVSPEREIAIAS